MFFGAQQITGALVLLVAIVLTLLVVIALFWRVRRLAALLLLPYLAWVCFATALNYQFLQLNPSAATRRRLTDLIALLREYGEFA